MAIAQQPTLAQILVPQTSGLTQVYIKGPGDDGLDNGLDDGLGGSLDDGLGDLIRRHTARKPDDKKRIKVGHTSKTMNVLEQFREVLKLDNNTYYISRFKDYLEKTMADVLTPTEIGIVFQVILHETENKQLNYLDDLTSERIGMFTTHLIQLSYNAGNNDFVLITENSLRMISEIGYRLNGKKDRMVKIKVRGDVRCLCHCSSYCDIDIDGNTYAGPSDIGYGSQKVIFTFRGKIPEEDCVSENSIYKTTNQETLEILIPHFLRGAYNQIVFINPDGTEEAVLRHTHDPTTGILINTKYYDLVEKIYREEDPEYKYSAMDKLRNIKKLQVIPIR